MQEAKTIKNMSDEEILRRQFQLLAKQSETCRDDLLPGITASMISLYAVLHNFTV